ncbi:MAG TPA: carboxypeptidase regulatory-like domain-containing protein, partial [Vicinamibacterales bacterium]|nr:carboxypeptidase regulatory-like domain-containing protein [Vicinamibacterales bacterium]
MTIRRLLPALMLVPAVGIGSAVQVLALPQAPPAQTAQPAPKAAPPAAKPATQKPRASQAARGTITFFITSPEGKPIPEATISMSGPATREGSTNKDGVVRLQAVRTGNYRVRAEAEGFISLERDVTMRNGLEVEMTLSPAPEPPEPPAPAAPPQAAEAPRPAVAPDPNATLQLSSVVEFFSKNRLGRNEPRRESVVGRSGQATSSLLQVRDTVEGRTNPSADEVLYVINGKAQVNSKGRIYEIETGSLILVPRGVTYSIANRGR